MKLAQAAKIGVVSFFKLGCAFWALFFAIALAYLIWSHAYADDLPIAQAVAIGFGGGLFFGGLLAIMRFVRALGTPDAEGDSRSG